MTDTSNVCPKCGLSHERLRIKLGSGLRFRTAHSSRHLLTQLQCGPAWGFLSRLIDAHGDEIEQINILDDDRGEIYRVDFKTFCQHAQRLTLDPKYDEQLFLPLKFWKVPGREQQRPGDGTSLLEAPRASQPTQPQLLQMPGAIFYRPATQPRPRRPLRGKKRP